jgi:hypothetical protein
MAAHVDVGPYALGVLDEQGTREFEEHLAGCDACAAELEALLPVVALLPPAVAMASAPDRQAAPAQTSPAASTPAAPVRLAARRRGRFARREHRTRSMVAVRGALALTGAAAVLGAVAGWGLAGVLPGDDPTNTAAVAPVVTPALPSPADGERRAATDPVTGTRADVRLRPQGWGTEVSIEVWGVQGPVLCRLVAVRASGDREVLSSWTVPEGGYGTTARPQSLALETSTALPASEMSTLEVEAVDTGGQTRTLLTLAG